MRWDRTGASLVIQWIDNKLVNILTTIENAGEFVITKRKKKINKKWQAIDVQQPKAVATYNQYMNGVDRSDQMLSHHNVLMKCMRWWKTLFFHMVDIAVVNGYILFQLHRKANPNKEGLKRRSKYSIMDFREELVRDLAGFDEYQTPPVHDIPSCPKDTSQFESDEHVVEFTAARNACKVCNRKYNVEQRIHSLCTAPQCGVYLHCLRGKNCFKEWHTKAFHD